MRITDLNGNISPADFKLVLVQFETYNDNGEVKFIDSKNNYIKLETTQKNTKFILNILNFQSTLKRKNVLNLYFEYKSYAKHTYYFQNCFIKSCDHSKDVVIVEVQYDYFTMVKDLKTLRRIKIEQLNMINS